MKRINGDQISLFVNQFLRRRNYTDHMIKPSSTANNKHRPNIVGSGGGGGGGHNKQRSADVKCKESLEEIALNGALVNVTSDADTVSLAHWTGEMTASAESAYKHFLDFVQQYRTKIRFFDQLSQLEFPLFLYIFIELFECGHKVSARRFFREHKNRFKESTELQTIDSMNKSLNTMLFETSLHRFKTSKYLIKISDKCLEQMRKHFKETNDLIVIQILNKSFEFNIHSTHNQNQLEVSEKKLEKCSQYMDTESLSVSDVQLSQTQGKDVHDFLQCIDKLRNSPPCQPPIRRYIVDDEDLLCATVNDDMSALALGFGDSRIYLKRFGQQFTSDPRFELKRDNSKMEFNLVDYNVEDLYIDNNNNNDDDDDDNENQSSLTNICDMNGDDVVDSETSCRTLRGHCGSVYGLAFCPRSDILLSCSKDTTVRAWDVVSGHNISVYNCHQSSVWAIDAGLIGNQFCTAGDECVAYMWSLERSQPIRMFVTNFTAIHCLKFHPNCKYIAFAEKDIVLWDTERAQEVRTYVGHEAPVHCLSFSFCGQYMASAGEDRKVIVWDINSGKALKELTGHLNSVYTVCFDHNNTLLSSSGADQTLRLWNLKNITTGNNNNVPPNLKTSASESADNTSIHNNNTSNVDSDQFMTYNINANVIYSQFMPRNLLLTIGKTI
ncbi:TAF5-like RNA polymerase II p300/CBP-associated factor-associated factor 65 kDa subunit 5L [Oppia nitens]|uniref:TAF5-like RNA polymerase II p300/CBP-associated factor-associated factor 65 kDa subunit 5L n=1 Tax=Oppia nitens TaxID=1686743 RepID=UPI0023DBFC6A|nr:TAF5-like RNA polymerase II p300/CBP-associated factor-associated factor 65 kDa subunit 5L [Oppia nitens]